jgi:hypothetical protein
MQAAFEVAEEDRDSLDALLIGEILEPFFRDRRGSGAALLLSDLVLPVPHRTTTENYEVQLTCISSGWVFMHSHLRDCAAWKPAVALG